ESEVPDEEEEATTKKSSARKGKKVKTGRKDVTAVRETTAGKASRAAAEAIKLKRKAPERGKGLNKKSKITNQRSSGLFVGWDRDISRSNTTATFASESSQDVDESMVRYGGLFEDEEDDEIERVAIHNLKDVPKGGSGKKTLPNLIKITDSKPKAQPTKKTIRNGAKKWRLDHLPPGTDQAFTKYVVPLMKAKAGELEHPWAELSILQIQDMVNKVFGADTHAVVNEDVWCGLITYRMSNWRNIFGSTAASAVKTYIESNPENMFVNGADDIAEFVQLYTEVQGKPPTVPFHWREWQVSDDETPIKKGRFQNQLIMYTLAHAHFADFDDVPATEKLNIKPVGALILAIQAVEHAFKSWTTGTYVKDSSPKGYFSADNYGDKIEKVTGKDGRTKHVNNRRATQYVSTITAFKDHHWESILDTVRNILGEDGKKRKRSKSLSSRASSEFDLDEVDAEEDYILVSDDD
ncbi:hypothetical protein BYT27DRAFT_7071855, partial [Phlegmacium glaucopus]